MTTFSQIVDDVIRITGRPDQILLIPGFVNQTIRELHSEPQSQGLVKYGENLFELEFSPDVDQGYVFTIPRVHRFQTLECFFYSTIGRYAFPKTPSTMFDGVYTPDRRSNYYRSGSNFILNGYGGTDSLVKAAWFEYPPSFKYYAVAARPATFNDETGEWTYLPAYVTDEEKETARDLVSCWLLLRYKELVTQGACAKVFARMSDSERGKVAYSLFQSGRTQLIAAETFVTETYYSGR